MNFVKGTGPKRAQLFFCAEKPGHVELSTGQAMTGSTGDYFNCLLSLECGLSRGEVYVTNLLKLPPKGDDPTIEEIAAWALLLEAELREGAPQLVVPLGALSTQYFLGDVTMEQTNGILHKPPTRPFYCLPIYNPAIAFKSPDMASHVVYGFQQLSACIRGELDPRVEVQARSRRLSGEDLGVYVKQIWG